jgi:hypothetical protein
VAGVRDIRLSAKLVKAFADRGCRVVTATDPHGRNLDFLDRCSVAKAKEVNPGRDVAELSEEDMLQRSCFAGDDDDDDLLLLLYTSTLDNLGEETQWWSDLSSTSQRLLYKKPL